MVRASLVSSNVGTADGMRGQAMPLGQKAGKLDTPNEMIPLPFDFSSSDKSERLRKLSDLISCQDPGHDNHALIRDAGPRVRSLLGIDQKTANDEMKPDLHEGMPKDIKNNGALSVEITEYSQKNANPPQRRLKGNDEGIGGL